MRRVVWTEPAQADVLRIRRYIARFRPVAAARMAEDLFGAAEALGEYPDRGKPLTKSRRELLIISPYRLIYRVTEDEVLILRVRHMARRPGFNESDLFEPFDHEESDEQPIAEALADEAACRLSLHDEASAWLSPWGTRGVGPAPKSWFK